MSPIGKGSRRTGQRGGPATVGESSDFEVAGFREFLPTPGDVVAARRFVHRTLVACGTTGALVSAAELVVDEFALNAVRHAETFFSVAVETAPGAVKIAVRDDSDVFPRIPEHAVTSIAGRGLTIVASTAEQWGAESLGRGKEVWAELR